MWHDARQILNKRVQQRVKNTSSFSRLDIRNFARMCAKGTILPRELEVFHPDSIICTRFLQSLFGHSSRTDAIFGGLCEASGGLLASLAIFQNIFPCFFSFNCQIFVADDSYNFPFTLMMTGDDTVQTRNSRCHTHKIRLIANFARAAQQRLRMTLEPSSELHSGQNANDGLMWLPAGFL